MRENETVCFLYQENYTEIDRVRISEKKKNIQFDTDYICE